MPKYVYLCIQYTQVYSILQSLQYTCIVPRNLSTKNIAHKILSCFHFYMSAQVHLQHAFPTIWFYRKRGLNPRGRVVGGMR